MRAQAGMAAEPGGKNKTRERSTLDTTQLRGMVKLPVLATRWQYNRNAMAKQSGRDSKTET